MLFECLVYNRCVPILVQPNYRKSTRNKDSESRLVFTTLSGRQQHLTHTGLGHREGMFTLGLYLLLHHWCRGVIDIVNSVSYSSLWAVSLRRAWSCEFPLFRIHSALLLCVHCIQCLKVRLLSANLRKCTQVWTVDKTSGDVPACVTFAQPGVHHHQGTKGWWWWWWWWGIRRVGDSWSGKVQACMRAAGATILTIKQKNYQSFANSGILFLVVFWFSNRNLKT